MYDRIRQRGFSLDKRCVLWMPFYRYGLEQSRIWDYSFDNLSGDYATAQVDLFDQEAVTARASGYTTVVGAIYRIVSRATLDFTTVGAPANTAGTVFICTSADALGAGDALSDITAPHKGIPDVDPWPALAGSEMVTDGGAEAGLPVFNIDPLRHWVATSAQSAAQAHSGSNSVKVTKTDTTTLASSRFANATLLGLSDNQLYRASVWVYLPSGQTVDTLRLLYMWDGTNSVLLEQTTTTDAWVNLTGYVPSGIWQDTTADRILWVQAANDSVSGEF